MEHNLKATVETPEKGVFKHIITDGEETLDIVTSDSAIHSFVLAYRPDHEMPLKPIPCNTPWDEKAQKRWLEKEGYTVLTVTTTFDPRRGTLIDTDGGILYVLPENGEAFTLAELYRYLDCSLIEVIRLTPEKIMIVDEEGKFKEDAQVNLRASRIAHWHDAIYPTDCVVGKVIICHTETLK